jgi:hypothetical protein
MHLHSAMRAPAAKRLDGARARAIIHQLTHGLETLLIHCSARYHRPYCTTIGCSPSAVCIGRVGRRLRHRKRTSAARTRKLACASSAVLAMVDWLCSLPGRSWCCCQAALPGPQTMLSLLPSALRSLLTILYCVHDYLEPAAWVAIERPGGGIWAGLRLS